MMLCGTGFDIFKKTFWKQNPFLCHIQRLSLMRFNIPTSEQEKNTAWYALYDKNFLQRCDAVVTFATYV